MDKDFLDEFMEKYKSEQKKSSGGVGIFTILLLIAQTILLTLKLTNVITWAWGVVLIPCWIYLGLLALGIVTLLICAIILVACTRKQD